MSIQNAGYGVGTGFPETDPRKVQVVQAPVDKRESTDQISQVLNERGARYGDFSHHAEVCQALKLEMMFHRRSKYGQLSADKKQALDVIADKIARILTGDPEYDDNWIDIQGYAKLAQERLKKNLHR